jgi:small subunit ribosomal protein S4
MPGITGENLLACSRSGSTTSCTAWASGTSRAQARQMVRHGHFQVNGRKTNIPSFQVKPTDVVEVREKSRENPAILGARDTTAHAPTPNWLEVDKENLRARVLAQPKREELVQIQINEQLIVELYSK